MKIRIKLFLLLCYSLPVGSILNAQLPVAAMQSEFDTLRNALEEAHGGLYRYSTKAQMDQTFSRLRARLKTPMTQYKFIGVVAELLAATRDGHMSVEYDEGTKAAISRAKLVPLRFLVEGDILRVLLNDSPADTILLPGMELVSVNDHPVNELLGTFMPTLRSDGFITSGKKRSLGNNFGLLYHLLIDTSSVFAIVAKDAKGNTVKATLEGVRNDDRDKVAMGNAINREIFAGVPKILKRAAENVSLRLFDGDSIAAIGIRSFSGDNYYNEIDSVFNKLQGAKVRTLIMDLRGNGGGVDEYGAYLVAQFMDQPFRYFDHIHLPTIHPSFADWPASTYENLRAGTIKDVKGGYLATVKLHAGVGEQRAGKHPFRGTVIVLTDGGTFSTAADVAALLRHLTKALFIGEETGGGYEGNTSGISASVKLHYSSLSVNIHQYDYYNAVRPARLKGRGTIPDYELPLTVADVIRGTDRAWDKAVEIARSR